MFIYQKNPTALTKNCATICINAEIRNIIQNWRKENKLPIDYVIPTLYVYFKEPIIKTALIEGKTSAQDETHLFELCQVSNVIVMTPNYEDTYTDDFYCWSPNGGTVGHGNVLDDKQKVIKNAIEKKAFDEWI